MLQGTPTLGAHLSVAEPEDCKSLRAPLASRSHMLPNTSLDEVLRGPGFDEILSSVLVVGTPETPDESECKT